MDVFEDSLDLELRRAWARRFRASVVSILGVAGIALGLLAFGGVSSSGSKAAASTVDHADLRPLTAEESAAADKTMWAQLASGWVAYGSYDANTRESVRGWIHMKATADALDSDLIRSQYENNHGGLPVFDRPDGEQVGVHFSMVGFVALSDASTFDPAAARLRTFRCDPLAADPAEGKKCMDQVIEADARQADIALERTSN